MGHSLKQAYEMGKAKMKVLISVLKARVGKKEGDNAFEILGKVLSSRAK